MRSDVHPPGPAGFSAPVRNLLAIRRDTPGFFLQLAREHGGAVSFQLGGQRIYFFSEPEAVREVFVTKAASLRKGFVSPPTWKMFRDLLGDGLLTSEEPRHARQRKLMVPAFHRERLAGYARIMTDACRARTAAWTPGAFVDLYAEFNRLTLTVVARALFGASFDDGGGQAITHAVDEFIQVLERTRTPWHRLTAKKTAALFARVKADLDAAVSAVIAEHRRDGTDRGDLLSVLMQARDEETGELGMDDQQIHDEVLTMLIAGHETTTSALTWAFALLAQHPEQEQRLHAEVDAVLAPDAPPGMAELGRLTHTRRVLTETMRLYPPIWAISRRTVEPVEIGGFRLPVGVAVMVSAYVTQRDPRWFPEPERFLPRRWEEGQGPERPKHAYYPFGGGTRSCAGEAFAWMEGTLVLAALARDWRFTLDPAKPPPPPQAAITLRPRGSLWVRLEKRA